MFVKKRCRLANAHVSKKRKVVRQITRHCRCTRQPYGRYEESEASREGTAADSATYKATTYRKLFHVVLGLLQEYCSNSTLHGVRYFFEKQRHWLERAWWIVGFVVSFCCCGALIHKVYDNWDARSVIVSFTGEMTPVWKTPFPAVTICPTTKIEFEQFNLTRISKKLPNITDEEFNIMLAYSNICPTYSTNLSAITTKNFDNSINDIIRKIARSSNDTVTKCDFRNYGYNCELAEIMTDVGLCFSFNILNGKEIYNNENADYSRIRHNRMSRWTLDSGYGSDINKNSQPFPQRVHGSGADADHFFVELTLSRQYFENSCYVSPGFSIVLHTPDEIPQVAKYSILVSTFQSVAISVKPTIIAASEGLRPYHPQRRKCYFNSDRKLRFLKFYTQRNCELECLSNFTLTLCGCVRFYMPRDVNMPICGPSKSACWRWAKNNLYKGPIRTRNFNVTEEQEIRLNQLIEECNCLPACNSITYDVEIFKLDLDRKNAEQAEIEQSFLSIFFKEKEFMTLTRSEFYGTIDFIANCGGLLGLFIGASFLSIVELFYYCSLRLYCKRLSRSNREGKNKMSISTTSTLIMIEEAAERLSKE